MAEGFLLIERIEDIGTAEADIKTKYTWTSVTEKHFIPVGDHWVLYAQGS